ncbi:Bud9p [Saccharomyces eubayanus]|uniref:Bud9p n=1 Tax=Saccharomyces eubayanus TaxID=1080349 RepID=UPI0006C480BE|nr:BUD9-like protein [Saccharomyces eubayanus]KOG99539.1 BUD9-like protein [Saccharomyces eubayanus]
MSQISRNDSATTDTSISTSGSTTVLSTSSSDKDTVSINQQRARIRSGSLFVEGSHLSPSSETKSYNIYIDDTKYDKIFRGDSTSSGTGSPQVFEDAKDDNFHEESHRALENSILDLIRRGSEAAEFPLPPPCSSDRNRNSSHGSSAETNPNGHSSSGTISTSVLLNLGSAEKHAETARGDYIDSSSVKSSDKKKERRSSSYYPPYYPPNGGSPQNEQPGNTVSKSRASSQVQDEYSSFSSVRYDDGFVPSIEEAVEVSKKKISNDASKDVFPDQTFIPHEFQIPKKAWNRPSAHTPTKSFPMVKTPRNHYLLTDILKPSEAVDLANQQRSPTLLNNTLHPNTWHSSAKEGPQPRNQDEKLRETNRSAPNHIYRSQAPLDVGANTSGGQNSLYHEEHSNNADDYSVSKEIGQENQDGTKYEYETFAKGADQEWQSPFQMHTIPIQRIDTSSIHSYDSQTRGFSEVYSISRIMVTLCTCVLIPPLFFFFSIDGNNGISNYRLMRMIMNHEHRIGLLKGFEWDIDIKWFRTLCFILGCIELLAIFAGIGIGFGVGVTRE